MIFLDYFSVFYLVLVLFLVLSSDVKPFLTFVYVIIFCVGAGINMLMFISDGLDPYER